MKRKLEMRWAYLFIAPALLGLSLFHLLPAAASLVLSFTEWNGLTKPIFVGLDNFTALFRDTEFIQSIRNTVYFTVISVPVSIGLATVASILLNQRIRGLSLYRTLYFVPVVTMSTAVGLIWKWLLNAEFGPVNYVLGLLHLPQPNWLSDPSMTMLSIVIVSIWSTVGYYMIILIAGLQGISATYYEAAEMDGASEWYQLFRITLPLLTPSLFFVLLIALINSLQLFDFVFVMTGGTTGTSGPNPMLLNSTRSIVYTIYDQGFVLFRMGYASAQAVVLFTAILAFTLVQFALQKKWVHYQ
ncbi:carbohydrate ABC transporter permease [Paenibacillus sp. YIM B09110]|uniref:carbohydrate ABC transporter permease n=1 Tax=Paenibacillus sp. YIM B09110 TaxID=3126102 RepID=UPI00301B930C